MLTETQRNQLAQSLRTMQIIVAALVAGVLTFLVIAIVVRGNQAPAGGVIANSALAFAVLAIVGWIVVPTIVTNRALQSVADRQLPDSIAQGKGSQADSDITQLAMVYQTRLIIACSVLEGAAFFNLIAYQIEGQWLSLVIAIALAIVMSSQFPMRNRLEEWVSRELETVKHKRV